MDVEKILKENVDKNFVQRILNPDAYPKISFDVDSLVREPYDSELEYFKSNPVVSGMATEDNRIILNPYSDIDFRQANSVKLNEGARIYMRNNDVSPDFNLTENQVKSFAGYGEERDVKETIAARILSRDPSALDATEEQKEWVKTNLRPVVGSGGKREITHYMSWGKANGGYIVFPTAIFDGEKLKLHSQREAMDIALETGEYIPFENADEADWFSKNYKRYWGK